MTCSLLLFHLTDRGEAPKRRRLADPAKQAKKMAKAQKLGGASWQHLPPAVHGEIAAVLAKKDRAAALSINKVARDLRALAVCADATFDFGQRDFRFADELKRDCKTVHTVTLRHLDYLRFPKIGRSGPQTQVGVFEFFARKAQKIKAGRSDLIAGFDVRMVAYLLLQCEDVAFTALDFVLSPAEYAQAEQQVLAVWEKPDELLQGRSFSEVAAKKLFVSYRQAALVEPGLRLARSVQRAELSSYEQRGAGYDPAGARRRLARDNDVRNDAYLKLPPFPALVNLTLEDIPKHLLPEVLLRFPAVRSLSLELIEAHPDPEDLFTAVEPVPTVKSLAVNGEIGMPFFRTLHFLFPNLKELTLYSKLGDAKLTSLDELQDILRSQYGRKFNFSATEYDDFE